MFKRHPHSHSNSNSHTPERGQSLLEFAIALPVLLILLLGVLDVGRMYFTFLAIQNAAGEGALFAAIKPKCIQPSDCPDPDNALYRATHESPAGLIDWQRVTIEAELPSPLIEGAPITITLHYEYDILTPLLSPLLPDGKLRLKARAVQNVIDWAE
ncbi:MAG TPA: TadE/TadG family type IV pilus assembly protein [Anaerolineae bacterium]|nr:TadE/TadG family type IV pilus assembly protein [Anaerolineae bacterium]